jgi:hypothetical protein
MIAAEEYTAHHGESLHTIMYEWGWRTFEGMFRRHLLRKAVEELRQMRDLRLAAIDANTNFDSQENQQARQARVEALQQAFIDARRTLYSSGQEVEQDPYGDDPLFNPLRQRAREMQTEASTPLVPQAGMGQQLLEATD